MKRCCIAAAALVTVGFAVGFAVPASAEPADLSTATCAEVLDGLDGDGLVFLTGWTDGYISARTKDYRFDVDYVEDLAKKIVEGCQSNGKMPFVKFIDKKLIQ